MFIFSHKTFRKHGTAIAAVFFLASGFAISAQAEDHVYTFKIPAENTAKALNDFARQANLQIMFPYDVAAKHAAPAISGQFTRAEILAKLLDGTGLEVAAQSDSSITIRVALTPAKSSSAADEGTTEVVVTGTHIRSGNPTSPVHTVTRADIDQSGYSQIGDLMRSLPENFSGGQNPGVQSGGAFSINQNNNNVTNASSINLRGLGSDATLVLVNGHRLSSDSAFQSSDISGLPLAAVQRVDVLTDGASAIYGADAVAGAVNIVMRRNYNGGEVSGRIGDTADGGGLERTVSLLSGITGAKGYLLVNGEASNSTAITWADRDIPSIGSPVNTLQQPQKRQSLFLSGGWDVSPRVRLTFDGLTSNRDTTRVSQASSTSPLVITRTVTPGFSAAAGLDVRLSTTWNLHVSAVDSGGRNSLSQTIPALSSYVTARTYNSVTELEATADGRLMSTAAGDIKLAVGAGTRQENYSTGSGTHYERSVNYAFGEILAPLVSPSETRTGLHELEVSLAGRVEDYSDFGRSWDPKIGVRYVPFNRFTVRATLGKSFKAPSFAQLHGTSQIYLYNATFVGGTGTGTVLMTSGGNPKLEPEKANSWTLGAEWKPISSSTLSVTYFDTDYTGRVVRPVNLTTAALSNPIYSPFVLYNPSTTDKAQAVAQASVFNNFSSGAYDPANVVALVYNTYANATSQQIRGLDAAYRQSIDLSGARVQVFANGTWLQLKQQTLVTLPATELSGTIFSVPTFKGRAGLSWNSGRWSITGIANYVAGETDTVIVPHTNVAAWTTVDANIGYRLSPQENGLLSGLKIVLAASNLFNKAPPYTPTPLANTSPHYDSTNTSIVGRFVSLTVAKSW